MNMADHIYQTFPDCCFNKNSIDTGIFVFESSYPKLRGPNLVLSNENMQLRVNVLKDGLNTNYELQFEIIDYGTDFVCIEDPTEVDIAQFLFHFCNYKQGIYLDRLSLPYRYIRKGIGTFCVNWLKNFINDFSINYIILGSVAEAREFWTKMGFRLLTPDELSKFPGYQGRYNR